MSPTQVAQLSARERLALIEQLWDSLDDADLVITPAQQDELNRRLARLDEDRAATVTWPELRRDLHQRLGK